MSIDCSFSIQQYRLNSKNLIIILNLNLLLMADMLEKLIVLGPLRAMKKTVWQHTVFWMILLSFSFMLTGKAIACFAPSAMEMGQGKAMDCCMERCRMETTHEAAQKACEKSRLAFAPKETLSSSNRDCVHSATNMVSDIKPLPRFVSLMVGPDDRVDRIQKEPPIKRHASKVALYTSIQTFLI